MTEEFNTDNLFKIQPHFMLLKSPSMDGKYDDDWAAEDYNEDREIQELLMDNNQFEFQF